MKIFRQPAWRRMARAKKDCTKMALCLHFLYFSGGAYTLISRWARNWIERPDRR